MPTLKECVEVLQSSVGGGVFTQENITEVKFAEQVLPYARGFCMKELYQKRNTINEIYYQSVPLIYEEGLQEDDCYTLYRYPVIQNINAELDGHQYIGRFKGDNSWVRVKSFGHYQNMKQALGNRIIADKIFYVLEPQDGLVRAYHNSSAVRPKGNIEGRSVFQNPLDELIPFNRQLDQYPITPECLSLAEQYLREGKFQRFLQRPSNIVANGADDINAGVNTNGQ